MTRSKKTQAQVMKKSVVQRFQKQTYINTHIVAISNVPGLSNKSIHQLDNLQHAITQQKNLSFDKMSSPKGYLDTNSNTINSSLKELGQISNSTVLNNLLIIATTQAQNIPISLLKNDIGNKDFVDQNGYAALHYAAIQGNVAKVKILLANGANVDIKNQHGNTPLHAAVILKRTYVIKLLLEKGAKVDAQDEYGNTAAHFAADAGDKDTIELLQAHKADFTIQDKVGLIALNYAIESIKYTRVKIDSSPHVTQDESSSKDSSNNSSSTSSPQQYFYQKLVNLMNTIKQLTPETAVIEQSNMKCLQGTELSTLLQSVDNFLEYCSAPIPPAGDLLTMDNLIYSVCE